MGNDDEQRWESEHKMEVETQLWRERAIVFDYSRQDWRLHSYPIFRCFSIAEKIVVLFIYMGWLLLLRGKIRNLFAIISRFADEGKGR